MPRGGPTKRHLGLLALALACLGPAGPAVGEPQPVIDRLAGYDRGWDMELAFSIAGDSSQRIYVGGRRGLRVRVNAAPANLPEPPVEQVLDLFNDGGLPDCPFVMGVGPDDCAYVGEIERQKLLRVCPNGEIDEVFDGSSYPTIPTSWEFPMRPAVTTPMDLTIAADGRSTWRRTPGCCASIPTAASTTRSTRTR